mgnify:FL=1
MIFHNEAEEKLYLTRAEQAYERLKDRYVLESIPLTATVAVIDGRPTFANKPTTGFQPISEGALWGMNWQTGWFTLDGTVPAAVAL